MTTNINLELVLELELDGIRGPYEVIEGDGTVTTEYSIDTFVPTTGAYIGAGVAITETSIKVISINGIQSPISLTIEALLAQKILETILKDAGNSVNNDFSGLWSIGHVKTTRGESDLIKDIINEKIENLSETL